MTSVKNETTLDSQYRALLDLLSNYGRVAVAYSGGVDSTLLMHAATDALGPTDALGIHADAPRLNPGEADAAMEIAHERGWTVTVFDVDEQEIDAFFTNPPDRCYHCKKVLFGRMLEICREQDVEVLVDGSCRDDIENDYRPGLRALKELRVKSPLAELGFDKETIRALSRMQELPTWNRPSAACLASRFPYGVAVTPERLEMVARAEAAVRAEGFAQARVRWHNEVARIEVSAQDMARFADPELRARLTAVIGEAGFAYVTLDLKGYRTGSLNETLASDTRNNA